MTFHVICKFLWRGWLRSIFILHIVTLDLIKFYKLVKIKMIVMAITFPMFSTSMENTPHYNFLNFGVEHHDDHTHDPGVSSVSIVCEGILDLEKVCSKLS